MRALLLLLLLLLCLSVSLSAQQLFTAITDIKPTQNATYYGVTNQPVFWLKADAQTLNNGDAVSAPVDSSGQGAGATFGQSSAGKQPTYRTAALNGLPTFYFDGGDCLTNPAMSLSSSFTMFFVTSNSANGLLIEQGSGANSGFYLYTDVTCSMLVTRTPNNSSKNNVADYGLGKWEIIRMESDGTHAGLLLSTNGVATSSATCLGSADLGVTTVTDQVNLGARLNGTVVPVTGHISEVLFFQPVLTGAALTTVASNIQAKYFP